MFWFYRRNQRTSLTKGHTSFYLNCPGIGYGDPGNRSPRLLEGFGLRDNGGDVVRRLLLSPKCDGFQSLGKKRTVDRNFDHEVGSFRGGVIICIVSIKGPVWSCTSFVTLSE